VTKFTGWVTEMFTFQLNVYTVAISSATKIVIIEWLQLNKTGFLMLLDFPLGKHKGPETFFDLDGLLVGLILLWNAVQCSVWSSTWPIGAWKTVDMNTIRPGYERRQMNWGK
jgi:hypothetical protein